MGITTTRRRCDLGHVGRSVTEQARRLGLAPSSLRRWITVGKELSSGRTLQLAATVTPETVYVADEALTEFLEEVTRDHMGD